MSPERSHESLPEGQRIPLTAREKLNPIDVGRFEAYLKQLSPEEANNQILKTNSELQDLLDIGESDEQIQRFFSESIRWFEIDKTAELSSKIMGEAVEKRGEAVEKRGEAVEKRQSQLDQLLSASKALDERIRSLSGGKSAKDLISDYPKKLEETRVQLEAQGKDPRFAESVVLLAHESDIFRNIEASTGKPLTTQDRKSLEESFSGLRNLAREQGLPSHTPVSLALANPTITLEAYSKIKLGFEPPNQLVHTNVKAGEIISSPALLTGERTIMTHQGERFREKSGLRISSPIPERSNLTRMTEELNTTRWELSHRKRITDTLSRITQWEFQEKIPPDKYPGLKLPDIRTDNPERFAEELKYFFSSPWYRNLGETPEWKSLQTFLESKLKQLYLSSTEQARLTQNAKSLESKNPEHIIKLKIAEQDRTIDGNLDLLVRLWVSALGQEKYDQLRDVLNRKLKSQAKPLIDDRSPINGDQAHLIRRSLGKLIWLTESDMYPDGSLSLLATNRLGNVETSRIERVFDEVE